MNNQNFSIQKFYIIDSQLNDIVIKERISGEEKEKGFPYWALGLLVLPIIAIPMIKKK